MPNDLITKQKLDKYFDVTGRALKKVKIVKKIPDKLSSEDSKVHSNNAKSANISWQKAAEDFLDMATRYYEDAKHFAKKGDIVTAFAALNYAHGWLDAGARIGLFDVGHDNELFTVD